ncbi:hypothetical protein PTSG_12955 [Salpingoeca rosetta]|uniref:BHLH domain-containing protein n=1 Tax=Salpingoeca rosetta (strain ATCC 50818 / BSB-021) TaxID=946362 RepID=F2UNJ7_SALR5|nr:uncharacterized protein PTSG_12955 [Salpingoeca rosetta]EGD79202.1 hypothetical protein PTSG_12955 [Salpingoeca rosetta]|eukprot:XP_004989287.1 hypothetical protein PTSG_12955 [Salpingoeca rosetta]
MDIQDANPILFGQSMAHPPIDETLYPSIDDVTAPDAVGDSNEDHAALESKRAHLKKLGDNDDHHTSLRYRRPVARLEDSPGLTLPDHNSESLIDPGNTLVLDMPSAPSVSYGSTSSSPSSHATSSFTYPSPPMDNPPMYMRQPSSTTSSAATTHQSPTLRGTSGPSYSAAMHAPWMARNSIPSTKPYDQRSQSHRVGAPGMYPDRTRRYSASPGVSPYQPSYMTTLQQQHQHPNQYFSSSASASASSASSGTSTSTASGNTSPNSVGSSPGSGTSSSSSSASSSGATSPGTQVDHPPTSPIPDDYISVFPSDLNMDGSDPLLDSLDEEFDDRRTHLFDSNFSMLPPDSAQTELSLQRVQSTESVGLDTMDSDFNSVSAHFAMSPMRSRLSSSTSASNPSTGSEDTITALFDSPESAFEDGRPTLGIDASGGFYRLDEQHTHPSMSSSSVAHQQQQQQGGLHHMPVQGQHMQLHHQQPYPSGSPSSVGQQGQQQRRKSAKRTAQEAAPRGQVTKKALRTGNSTPAKGDKRERHNARERGRREALKAAFSRLEAAVFPEVDGVPAPSGKSSRPKAFILNCALYTLARRDKCCMLSWVLQQHSGQTGRPFEVDIHGPEPSRPLPADIIIKQRRAIADLIVWVLNAHRARRRLPLQPHVDAPAQPSSANANAAERERERVEWADTLLAWEEATRQHNESVGRTVAVADPDSLDIGAVYYTPKSPYDQQEQAAANQRATSTESHNKNERGRRMYERFTMGQLSVASNIERESMSEQKFVEAVCERIQFLQSVRSNKLDCQLTPEELRQFCSSFGDDKKRSSK